MFMLDTNVCIDFALGRSALLKERIAAAYGKGLAISAITLAELRVGARHGRAESKDDERLDNLVRVLSLREFDAAAADSYAAIARRVGIKRRSFDRLIAAHALSLGLTLVTANGADFADVPGLKIENWTA